MHGSNDAPRLAQSRSATHSELRNECSLGNLGVQRHVQALLAKLLEAS